MPDPTPAAPPPPAATPPAAPPQAPAPAPATQPASAPSGSRGSLQDSFAELDGLAGKPPEKPAPKDESDEPAEPDAKPDADHSDLEAATKPKTDPQQKPQPKVASLRAAYEKSKAEMENLRKELQARESALMATKKEFDEFKAKPSAILPEFENVKKRNEELEEAIKYSDYKRSREYVEKYQKPIEQAYAAALDEVTGLPIEGDDRKATDKDFYELLQASPADAARRAAELFGPAAPIVLQHRSQVLRASGMRAKAEKDFQELSKQREQQFASKAEAVYGTYKSTAAELSKKFPELFVYDAEKDKDLAEAFANGEKLADTAFLGFADNTGDPETPLKVARVQGAVRMRAAALVPTLMKLRKAEEEIKGLKEKLGAYEKSEPAAGISRQNGADPEKSWQQEIEELATSKR